MHKWKHKNYIKFKYHPPLLSCFMLTLLLPPYSVFQCIFQHNLCRNCMYFPEVFYPPPFWPPSIKIQNTPIHICCASAFFCTLCCSNFFVCGHSIFMRTCVWRVCIYVLCIISLAIYDFVLFLVFLCIFMLLLICWCFWCLPWLKLVVDGWKKGSWSRQKRTFIDKTHTNTYTLTSTKTNSTYFF